MASPGPSPTNTGDAVPVARNKTACDVCRVRKVKCLFLPDQQVCEGCRTLGIACTHNKPRRRRGPANRFAPEQSSRRSTASVAADSSPRVASPRSPNNTDSLLPAAPDLQITSSPSTVNKSLSLTTVARPLLIKVLSDWAQFIYPLAPIQHKRRLLKRIIDHEDEKNPVFRAVILSTCAMTISTLRRRSFETYRDLTVDECIDAIEQDRLLYPVEYTLDWCVSCYNIASALLVVHGVGSVRSYRAIKDAMAGVQWLLYRDAAAGSLHDVEMLKRLYWLVSMWQLNAELRGQPHMTFLPSAPFAQDLDGMRPQRILDSDLLPHEEGLGNEGLASLPQSESWLDEGTEYITGLNSMIDLGMVWEHVKVDMTHKEPADTLRAGMTRVQAVLDSLIPELRWCGGLARFPRPCWGHEAQMVNILITSLYLKSNLMQHLGHLPGFSHQNIVNDLLQLLEKLPDTLLESNGVSIVHKVRDIGAAYLQELRVTSDGLIHVVDEPAQRAVSKLLMRLENLDFMGDLPGLEPRHVSST